LERHLGTFQETNEKLQVPALDVCHVYLVSSSLNVFIYEQRGNSEEKKKLVEYETRMVKMSRSVKVSVTSRNEL
jgi:hypothetical protein